MPAQRKTIPLTQAISPPPGLPPAVAAEFQRVAVLLDGRLRPEDVDLLTLYSTSLVTWREATALVAAQGRVVSSGGTAIPHPALSIAAQAHGQVLQLARELGLSPAARKKMSKSKATRPAGEEWFK